MFPLLVRVVNDGNKLAEIRFIGFISPAFSTIVIFILLAPLLLRKQSICENLYCDGDLGFFGDSFPETLVEMTKLRKTPKPSNIPRTYEELLYRNMRARIRNLRNPQFWRLLWDRWVCGGCTCSKSSEERPRTVLNYVCVPFWLPFCVILVILHVVPLFSIWANYLRRQVNLTLGISDTTQRLLKRIAAVPLLLMQLLGIVTSYIMMWNLLLVLINLVVFLCIDGLRNVMTTMPKIIFILALVVYPLSALAHFENGYRQLKSVTFDLCIERVKASTEDGINSEVVIKQRPCEPLYIVNDDGECSIPRRIFYDICKTYRPYHLEVIATVVKLFILLVVILIMYALIVKFQIFEEFTGEWETMLTICTLALPAMLGMMRSSSLQKLSDQRRKSNLRAWLEKITTIRKRF